MAMVGFVGLGNMGRPMALNLIKKGFALVVNDIDPAKVEPLRAKGAKVVESAEQVAAETSRMICMVETTAQAESVITGEHGFVRSASLGSIVVCMSTIDPIVLKCMGGELATRGIAMLDKVLPLVTNMGVGVILQMPLAQGADPIPYVVADDGSARKGLEFGQSGPRLPGVLGVAGSGRSRPDQQPRHRGH